MENLINYYYGINVINICKIQEKFYFIFNEKKYYFIKYDRDRKDLKGLIDICVNLRERNVLTNEIIPNKFNKFLTEYNGQFYVLIKENSKDYKIGFNDILYMQNNTSDLILDKNLVRNNFIELWKSKIDYYEIKLCEMNSKYQLINKTIDYYIGLGENAISYVVNNNIRLNHMVLSHRRINYSMNSFDFYNPINYIIDSRARDFADYIKSLFFFEEISIEYIISLLHYINFDRDEYILFMARMLFPTYYFDLIDEIVLSNKDEEILKGIVDKNEKYIELLKGLFLFINYNQRMNIPVIDWIIKK